LPAGAGAGALQACTSGGTAAPLEGPTLEAVAEVTLPAELGPEGIRRVVLEFRQWLADYQPAAETNHGYGTADLEYTPAHPGPGWASQLEALDLEANQRHGMAFAHLDRERRTGMIRAAIGRDRSERLGDPSEARHVAVGLLSYFYARPEAANLCYQAAIDRFGCRPLSEVAQHPRATGA
jgi:hypothetical protein